MDINDKLDKIYDVVNEVKIDIAKVVLSKADKEEITNATTFPNFMTYPQFGSNNQNRLFFMAARLS